MYYSRTYDVLQQDIRCIIVGHTQFYTGTYTVLQWDKYCIIVGHILNYNGTHTVLKWDKKQTNIVLSGTYTLLQFDIYCIIVVWGVVWVSHPINMYRYFETVVLLTQLPWTAYLPNKQLLNILPTEPHNIYILVHCINTAGYT